MSVMLSVATFHDRYDKIPKRELVGWDQLKATLTNHQMRTKKDGPLWSPTIYTDGSTRCKKDVLAITAFVADFDSGRPYTDFTPVWDAMGLAYCIHSTYSSTEDSPKWRVTFPLDMIIKAADWEEMHRRLVHALCHAAGETEEQCDPVCKDASRIYYLPSCPPGSEPFTLIHEGKEVEVMALPDPPPIAPPPFDIPTGPPHQADIDCKPPIDIIMRLALTRVPAMGRNNAGFWFCCQCRDNDHSESACRMALPAFVSVCPGTNTKGEHEEYSLHDAELSCAQAYSQPRRSAWPWEPPYAGKKGGWKAPVEHDGGAAARVAVDEEGETTEVPADDGGGGAANERNLTRRFVSRSDGRLLTTDGGKWFAYDAGRWKTVDPLFVGRMAQQYVMPLAAANSVSKLTDKVIKNSSRELFRPVASLNNHPTWIPLKNVIYDTADGTTREHAPEHLLTIQLPYDYDPQAVCPMWEHFLGEVLVKEDGDPDPELIRLMQEWFGYCLTSDVQAQTSLIWVGSGANGKGVATKVLENLVGRENACGLDVDQLHDPYHRAALYGKLLATVNEMPRAGLRKNGGHFKAIVGGDSIEARHPAERVFTFEATVKVLVSANELPSASDRSFGYFRRVKIMSFLRHFKPSERDTGLTERLLTELPGIFNWAIVGLERLRANDGKFSDTPGCDASLEEYREDEDAPRRFMVEWCSVEDDDECFSHELHKAYQEWAKECGEEPMAAVTLGREMKRLEKPSQVVKKNGRAVRVHKGIRPLNFAERNAAYNTEET